MNPDFGHLFPFLYQYLHHPGLQLTSLNIRRSQEVKEDEKQK
jgi:hypothetical protein